MAALQRDGAVIYQVYPRSFQDSDGDGIGDLPGVTRRLDHIAALGCDAVWLTPFFPSPQADFGYDVADYEDVDPVYGSLADLDALTRRAHELGLRVLLDFVPCHTSIAHPWFHEHPERYIWHGGDRPPNNWLGCFGGAAWTHLRERDAWYLHSFYPEQPDLDWRNPEVPREVIAMLRRWQQRGIDGFRLDAIDRLFKDAQLRDNPPRRTPPVLWPSHDSRDLEPLYTTHRPETFEMLARLRAELPQSFLVAEAYVSTARLQPYLRHVDCAYCFELLQAPLDALTLARIIQAAAPLPGIAWMLSNHDFPRLVSRWGAELARVAAVLLLTLPGVAFIYQGDEVGAIDGGGAEGRQLDRYGRDAYRHPMQWTRDGGFTTGTPWLPMVDPAARNIADAERDRDSLLWLYRDLIRLRRELSGAFELGAVEDETLRYCRGDAEVVVNLGDGARALPSGEVLLRSDRRPAGEPLSGRAAAVLRH